MGGIPQIRPVQAQDDTALAQVIRSVLIEMGVPKVGSAYADPSLDAMYAHYQQTGSAYFVIEYQGRIVGGGGVAALEGASDNTCELQKMYFLPELRGMGMGQAMISKCIAVAQEMGYTQMYLETMPNMQAAQNLYQKMGFEYLSKAMGNTGHSACPVWMLLRFKSDPGTV